MRFNPFARMAACAVVLPLGFAGLVLGESADSSAVPPRGYEPTIRCVNLDPDGLADIQRDATAINVKVAEANGIQSADRASIVVWEASQSADFDDAQAAQLGEYVRGGGNLLLTLDQKPGKGPFRLRFMLPTTAWYTTMFHGLQFARSVHGAEWDPAMFPTPPADAPAVPYFFMLRPFDTVERGQGRHEPLAQKSIVLSGTKFGGDFQPWDPIFTRPLINRDWQVRARTDDLGASGLLLTGRYGAGSVAVFASSAHYMGKDVAATVFRWMKQNQSAPASPSLSNDQITSKATVDAAHRTLNLELSNQQHEAVKGELVARILTWENALIGDVDRPVEIPASGTTRIAIPMPPVDANAYQALQFKDAFIVRSGLLSGDGRQIVGEQRTSVDLQPAASVAVSLDNLRAVPYPFKGPGLSGLSQFNERMGEPVMAYSYPPGASVSAVVGVCNGLQNIAPGAQVQDETQPRNLSTPALNDGNADAEKVPRDDMQSYGWWVGKADTTNSLLFTFPTAVTVNQIVLNGNPDEIRHRDKHNPAEVIVETDAGQAADVKGLDAAFKSGFGLVHVPIASTKTQHVRIKFPWDSTLENGDARLAPTLGEIEIIGWTGDSPPALRGKLTVSLVDEMHQTRTTLLEQQVQVDPKSEKQLPVHFTAQSTADSGGENTFDRVEARFVPENSDATLANAAPLMVIQPVHPLHSLSEIRPPGHVEIGFIVTRGFRNTSPLGTGTQQVLGSWGSPDDLVYAYEHMLKQTPKETTSTGAQFFVTEQNFKHYAAPWSLFPNGEVQFEVATPHLVSLAKSNSNWKSTDTVAFGFGDRWDTGPSGYTLYSWQELVQFDQYLASQNLPRLQGKTRGELTQEINSKYDSRWSAWQMARYANSVKTMRDAFAQAGKKLVISGQGLPLVPLKYLDDLAQTIMGFSDDSTWGMWGENIPVTTGREMALMAFNPDWKVSEVLVPGYDSAGISTRFWAVVGTTESTRRHFFDPGWRAVIGSDGVYHCMNTFGFNMNGSSGYCMNLNDWQEDWRLQERLALLSPDGPVGAGVIVSNAAWDDPDHTTYSGGGMGDSEGDEKIHNAAKAIGAFAEIGIPISFSANVTALGKWSGSAPLILLGLNELSAKEIETLTALHQRGVRMIAVSGAGPIPAAMADLFGVTPDGKPTTGKIAGNYQGAPVVTTDQTLLINGPYDNIDTANLRPLLGAIKQTLNCGLDLPPGTGGYGFTMGKQRYIVLEDWREEPRTLSVRVKAAPAAKQLMVVNVDDHTPLSATRDGSDWIISVPTRPGDGTLLCMQEQ